MELASRQAGKISPSYKFFQLKPGQKRVTERTQGRNQSPGPTQEGLARWPGQCLLSPSLSSEEQVHWVMVISFIITRPGTIRRPSPMMGETTATVRALTQESRDSDPASSRTVSGT